MMKKNLEIILSIIAIILAILFGVLPLIQSNHEKQEHLEVITQNLAIELDNNIDFINYLESMETHFKNTREVNSGRLSYVSLEEYSDLTKNVYAKSLIYLIILDIQASNNLMDSILKIETNSEEEYFSLKGEYIAHIIDINKRIKSNLELLKPPI